MTLFVGWYFGDSGMAPPFWSKQQGFLVQMLEEKKNGTILFNNSLKSRAP